MTGNRNRWFLPEVPDVLGMLHRQWELTSAAAQAFAAWARGDAAQSDVIRRLEHEADEAKRALWRALRSAFVTPVDAEDLFAMSADLDEVLNGMKDAVREAEACLIVPDAAVATMADLLLQAVDRLGAAFARLVDDTGEATLEADEAVHAQRAIEHVYRDAVPALIGGDDLRDAVMRRELYLRIVTAGERVRAVAERIWYCVVKES